MSNKLNLVLNGLNCAHCAGKIEKEVNMLSEVDNAVLNFVGKEINIILNNDVDNNDVILKIKKIVNNIEPSVTVYNKNEKINNNDDKKKLLIVSGLRFGFGLLFFIGALLYKQYEVITLCLFIISYLLFGADVLYKAVRNITKGDLFDENFLMSIATIGAFLIGEYPEGVAVMLFYQIGEFFQDYAVESSRKSIKKLMNIKPESANIVKGENVINIKPEEIKKGDIVLVKAGEKIPVDGIVLEGSSYVDMTALTGESLPEIRQKGDNVLSGSINKDGILKIEALKGYEDSTVVKILEMVESAGSRKSKTENFLTKFAKIYTPIVVFAALIICIVPSLITHEADFSIWFSRALVFLVSSCPCALVVSVPLSFFSGIGEASRKGILIKGSNYLQKLTEVDTFVFDKTGTLTKGIFDVSNIYANNIDEKELVKYIYSLEINSNHPVAKSIVNYYERNYGNDKYDVDDFEEISGNGLKGIIENKVIIVGKYNFIKDNGIILNEISDNSTQVYAAYDGKFIGCISVSDIIKNGSQNAIKKLKALGISNTIMFTGDKKAAAEYIGDKVGIDKIYSQLLPNEKVEKLENLYNSGQCKTIAFTGDGINDAPIIKRADVGIAMGAIGSDAAIEAADVVIMNDEPEKIAEAVLISRNTLKLVKENVAFVLIFKAVVLILAAFGAASMWLAVFADVGTALLAILNSMRKK